MFVVVVVVVVVVVAVAVAVAVAVVAVAVVAAIGVGVGVGVGHIRAWRVPLLLCAVPAVCVVKKDTCALRPLEFGVGGLGV